MRILLVCVFSLTAVLADEVALKEFMKANNLFTISAYKETSKQHRGNFVVSPFSAETALALAQAGCKAETAEEIRNALRLPNDKEKIESGFKKLLATLNSCEHCQLHHANKMYVQKDYAINEEFKKTASEIFGAESENVDFTRKEEAATTMNSWVEKHTNNKIHNLIDSNSLNNRSRSVLINALYFKADWLIPFLLSDTSKGKFYKTAEDVVEVDMMDHSSVYKDFFNYYECSHLDAKIVELPFNSQDASMTIILPNQKEGLAALENQLDKAFSSFNFTQELINLGLPKFKIENKIDFKELLSNLGVKKAFDKDYADLSGIAGKKGDLIIDKIIQKTFVDVSEEGVEAAAATYVLVGIPTSALLEEPKDFIADHPFIFYIKVKEVIVFAGRVMEP